ncbi:MAG: hypothetical protein PHW53_04720 [Patescibacteria group bacterium]|nr:hypothetical protein [Patescibacteria group bacterium]
MKLKFKKTKTLTMYSGDGYRLLPGDIVDFSDEKGKQLLADLPDNFEPESSDDFSDEKGKQLLADLPDNFEPESSDDFSDEKAMNETDAENKGFGESDTGKKRKR